MIREKPVFFFVGKNREKKNGCDEKNKREERIGTKQSEKEIISEHKTGCGKKGRNKTGPECLTQYAADPNICVAIFKRIPT